MKTFNELREAKIAAKKWFDKNMDEELSEKLKLEPENLGNDAVWKIMDGSGYTGWNVVKDKNKYVLETEYGDRAKNGKKYNSKEAALRGSNL